MKYLPMCKCGTMWYEIEKDVEKYDLVSGQIKTQRKPSLSNDHSYQLGNAFRAVLIWSDANSWT